MATKLQRLRHYAELLRRQDVRCVQPKGMRKRNTFFPAGEGTEEKSSRDHRILHTAILFLNFVILIKYCKKSNRFEL